MRIAASSSLAGPLALLIIVACHVPLFADPGFGVFRRRTIDLQLRRPAVVRLANTSIAFKSEASDPQYRPILASLEATLETELVSNERTLVKRPLGDAEWIVELTVTGFSAPAATKRVERAQKSTTTYVRWTGTANVAYQVVDRGGRVHDADNVSYTYNNEVVENPAANTAAALRLPNFLGGRNDGGTAPRTVEDVKQILVTAVVQQIAANLGNTVQVIEAQLAGGDPALDRAAEFMSKQLWARAVEELEKQPAFAKPEDESYRQYSLGLAYEAMSYDSKTFNEQRANLFKAQECYDKALEMNREQRYFVDVVARTRESVARYRTLEAAAKEDRAKQAPTVTPTAGSETVPPPPASSEPASKALTVSDVIEMHAVGVPTGDIIQLIERSALEFQLDRETVLAVAKAKLPISIQNAMRRKAGLQLLPEPGQGPASAGPKPAGSK